MALDGHPALAPPPDGPGAGPGGVQLWAGLREVKTAGGLDSVGAATGDGILARAQAELAAAVGGAEAARLAGPGAAVGDCARAWWTPAVLPEPDHAAAERARAVVAAARCDARAAGGAAVLVGHSLLFRGLAARLLAAAPPAPDPLARPGDAADGGGASAVERNRPGLAAELRRGRKLGNAAVLAIEVPPTPPP